MSTESNNKGELSRVVTVCALAAIVGVLILIQLFRAQPLDDLSIGIIAVCFVAAVTVSSRWGRQVPR